MIGDTIAVHMGNGHGNRLFSRDKACLVSTNGNYHGLPIQSGNSAPLSCEHLFLFFVNLVNRGFILRVATNR